jgi:hypothetical protein
MFWVLGFASRLTSFFLLVPLKCKVEDVQYVNDCTSEEKRIGRNEQEQEQEDDTAAAAA